MNPLLLTIDVKNVIFVLEIFEIKRFLLRFLFLEIHKHFVIVF